MAASPLLLSSYTQMVRSCSHISLIHVRASPGTATSSAHALHMSSELVCLQLGHGAHQLFASQKLICGEQMCQAELCCAPVDLLGR
jgi:hypothetical protein